MPSGVDGGRKQPIRMPCPAQVSTAASASCGPGIGTESTAPAGGSTPQARARVAALRPHLGRQRRVVLQRAQRGERGAGRGGRQPGVVDERTGAVLTRCSRTAGWPSTAPPWAPRDLDRVTVRTTWSSREMPAAAAQALAVVAGDAQPVRLVDEQHRVVAAGDRGEVGQRGRVAEHAVDRLDERPRPGPRTARPAAARRRPRRCGRATTTRARDRRAASMREACTWASETTRVSASVRAVTAPRLAA